MQKVVDTIKIEKLEGGAFNVVQGDRYSDQLGWEEMLGLVSALTIAKEPMCLSWMKTKEEHERQLEAMKNIPSEVEFEDILVPGEIEIYSFQMKASDYGDGLFIAFNNNKQLLGYCDTSYCVEPRAKCYLKPIQCKLVPCNRKDLKAGDTAFSCLENFDISRLNNYCKVLNETDCTLVDSGNIRTFNTSCFNWYKVIPV